MVLIQQVNDKRKVHSPHRAHVHFNCGKNDESHTCTQGSHDHLRHDGHFFNLRVGTSSSPKHTKHPMRIKEVDTFGERNNSPTHTCRKSALKVPTPHNIRGGYQQEIEGSQYGESTSTSQHMAKSFDDSTLSLLTKEPRKLRTDFFDKHYRQKTTSPRDSPDSIQSSYYRNTDTLQLHSFENVSDIESDTSDKDFSSTYEDADPLSPRQYGLFDMACATRHRLGHSNKCPSTSRQPPCEKVIPNHRQGSLGASPSETYMIEEPQVLRPSMNEEFLRTTSHNNEQNTIAGGSTSTTNCQWEASSSGTKAKPFVSTRVVTMALRDVYNKTLEKARDSRVATQLDSMKATLLCHGFYPRIVDAYLQRCLQGASPQTKKKLQNIQAHMRCWLPSDVNDFNDNEVVNKFHIMMTTYAEELENLFQNSMRFCDGLEREVESVNYNSRATSRATSSSSSQPKNIR